MAEADGDELPEFRGTAGDEQCPSHTDLQTLDGGAPVSIYTVSRELGHTSPAMVQRVYAHLGTIRHRLEVVEYRVEQHRKALGGRLEALERAATGGESPLCGQNVTRLIADVATAVADLDHRVVMDKPKPDPEGVVSSRRVGGQGAAGQNALHPGRSEGPSPRLSKPAE